MTTQQVGRKTGPKPKFHAADVIAAAIELGIDQFTLSGVATKLGIATSAVYRLFDGRDALVDACLAYAARSMFITDFPVASWQEILRDWGKRTWEVCEQFPGLDITLFKFPAAHTHIDAQIRTMVELLMNQGFSKDQALFAIDFVGDSVVASHIGVTAMRAVDDSGKRGLDKAKDRVGADPTFVPDESWTSNSPAYEKVEFIIRGLEQELS